MPKNTKQMLVLRKDLGMRKGKMIAQGAHASVNVILEYVQQNKVTKAMQEWFDSGTAKIAVSVNSEEELLRIYKQALDAGIPAKIVRDAGHTEFHGVATLTAVAIGPDYTHKIDKITGDLKLL